MRKENPGRLISPRHPGQRRCQTHGPSHPETDHLDESQRTPVSTGLCHRLCTPDCRNAGIRFLSFGRLPCLWSFLVLYLSAGINDRLWLSTGVSCLFLCLSYFIIHHVHEVVPSVSCIQSLSCAAPETRRTYNLIHPCLIVTPR